MPSIPGFGFSDKPREPGWDPARIAAHRGDADGAARLPRYGAQGGDWGAIISTQVALAIRAHVAGLHLNMCIGGGRRPAAIPMRG